MNRRMLGLILLVVGVVGIIMCAVTMILFGADNMADIETMSVYGGLGLVMFATGIEFLRHHGKHYSHN
jgi:hypothetical protein